LGLLSGGEIAAGATDAGAEDVDEMAAADAAAVLAA